jgi:phosphoglycolate phosphatase-like HAD superfamily hydrolase
VTSTPFDVYVFDFDGTLVDSAAAKRQAFFDIFPPDCAASVAAVLERDPDGSRHHVIPAMIAEAKARGVPCAPALVVDTLVAAYGEAAGRAVRAAPEMPDAGAALRRAAERATCYVASMTPQDDIVELVSARGWNRLVREAFGFPHAKADVVATLLGRHRTKAHRLIVVGDGVSDADAAAAHGCAFHRIRTATDLATIPGLEVKLHA